MAKAGELTVGVRVLDLPAFNELKGAARAWLKQVTQPGYSATDAERALLDAFKALTEGLDAEQ